MDVSLSEDFSSADRLRQRGLSSLGSDNRLDLPQLSHVSLTAC
jgi:hypothetical protein